MLLLLIFSKVFELFCWRLTSSGYRNDCKLFYSVFLLCLEVLNFNTRNVLLRDRSSSGGLNSSKQKELS